MDLSDSKAACPFWFVCRVYRVHQVLGRFEMAYTILKVHCAETIRIMGLKHIEALSGRPERAASSLQKAVPTRVADYSNSLYA